VVDPPARSVTAPTDGGAAVIGTVAAELAERGVAVDDIGLRQPTLDDVFLTLTGAHAEAVA
jgi:ABC-2 type transport system ATP-binding protein